MVFFHFGQDSSSWAVGNDCYSFEYNLDGQLKAKWDELGALFHDKSMAGTRIQWLSTSPDGSFCLQERNGTIYTNRTDLIEAIREIVQSGPSWNPYTVDHVSFSPYGAWFMSVQPSIGQGLVQLGAQGRFPDSFISLAAEHLDFTERGLQQSTIQYVFFGAQDGVLLKFSNGNLWWDRLGPGIRECLDDACSASSGLERMTVGRNTVLCPYDIDQYFVQLVPVIEGWAGISCRYSLGCEGLTVDFMNAIIQGGRPTGGIPKPTGTKKTSQPPSQPVAAQKETGSGKVGAEDGQADDGKVPAAAREIFQKSFDEFTETTGRNYLTGLEASAVMRETGLADELLSEIWERTDADGNGKFDREEFVQAMWLIAVELARLQEEGVVPQQTNTDPKVANNALNAATNFAAPRRTNTMPPDQQPGGGGSAQESSKQDASELDKVSKKFGDMQLRESLMDSIVSEKPDVKWDDVAGLAPAKEELQEAIIFPLRFPQLFQGKRKARRAILLYGPPGTGKSYLAKAVATEVEHTLFSISSGDVMSKWYGDSEGLVRQLFELAREKKPAIIFIDEIDALCSNRDGGPGGSNEHTARMKTEFLVQMDGVGKDNSGVLILAATNLPWALDPAVRRRFQKRIHIPLPDFEARKQLFKIHLGPLGENCSEKDFDELARRSDGFSGSDVANAIQDGLMVPIKKVHMATHFKKVRQSDGVEYYMPCDKSDRLGVPMTWKKVPANKLKEPPLTADDLFAVMANVKASVAQDELARYHEWTQQFGLEGA